MIVLLRNYLIHNGAIDQSINGFILFVSGE